jgi:drug/metabolite transporter superfamily protein YnfA
VNVARTLVVLVGAALLEVGGDALIRRGLQQRRWFLLFGALCLAAYGVMVNQGGVNFGRLLGGYIAVFFAVSQLIALVMFREAVSWQTMVGGTLIVAGGFVLLIE